MIIREAAEADWEAIYPFFQQIVAAGDTYAYPTDLPEHEARAIWMGAERTVVAVDGDTILGSATMGPNRPGRGAHIATASFMVDPLHHGRGTGRALGENVVVWARASSYRGIQFNAVVETNDAAIRLWQSLGFRIIGTVPGAFKHPELGYVGLHVMYLEL